MVRRGGRGLWHRNVFRGSGERVSEGSEDECVNGWQYALKLLRAKKLSDPQWGLQRQWSEHHIEERPTERCVRWDYNAEKDSWEESVTLVKMETADHYTVWVNV